MQRRLGWIIGVYVKQIVAWLKKHQRLLIISSLSVIGVIILIQVLYPRDRALPFASIAGKNVAFASVEDIKNKLDAYQNIAKVSVIINDKTTTKSLTDAGISINVSKTADMTVEYPLWQRFVPLSIIFSKIQSQVFNLTFDESSLDAFSGEVSESSYRAPKNATLVIEGEKVEVVNDETGAEIQPSDIITGLKNATYRHESTEVLLKPKVLPVARTVAGIQDVKQQAEKIIATTTNLSVADKKYDVSKAELASWITFQDSENNELTVALSDEKMNTYLASISKEVTIAPGTTIINMIDGNEVSRTTGANGRGIDTAAVKKSIQEAVFAGKDEVAIKTDFVTLQPIEKFNKQFSATQVGLQAYVNDLAATKNINIALQQIGGSGWTASAKAGDQVISASTYKLFVAFVLFEKIKANEYTWEQPMLDTTIAGCFDRMIVRSDNPCAEKFIDMFTTKTLDAMIHGAGFSRATTFRSTEATKTSATDQLRLLIGIQNGSIIGGSDRERLLSAMGRQIFRQGLPAGSAGSVQNKVGFYNGTLNDSGIVTTARGTYAISILTRNSSWGEIAQITRQIESLMYP